MASPMSETNTETKSSQITDPAKLIESLREEMARVGEQVQEFVQARGGQIAEQASKATEQASKVTAEAAENARDLVRENPGTSVAIAAGAGLVLGLILSASRRNRRHTWYDEARNLRERGVSRRDLDRLSGAIRDGFERVRSHNGDSAFVDRIATAVSNLLDSSASTASTVASAGSRVAKNLVERLASGRTG